MNYYLNAFNEMLRKRQENQMGRGGDGRSANPQFDAMSNTQRASYYSDNPTMAAITQGLQKGFGMTSYGMLQNALVPDFVREQGMVARGIDPGIGIQGQGTTGQTGLYGDQFAGQQSTASGFLGGLIGRSEQAPAPVGTRDLMSTPNPSMGSSVSLTGIAPTVAEMNQYDAQGNNYGGTSFGGPNTSNSFGEGEYNQGGMVNAQHLMGRAPAPDDGYGALQGGEYVITKAAVERYGKAMMDAINNGTFR
jgi:hypothetical protein